MNGRSAARLVASAQVRKWHDSVGCFAATRSASLPKADSSACDTNDPQLTLAASKRMRVSRRLRVSRWHLRSFHARAPQRARLIPPQRMPDQSALR